MMKNTKTKHTYTRDYYEVQYSGIDESTKDRWFVSSRRAKTLEKAREELAEVRRHWELCNGFLYTGPEPRRRIVHVVATCTVVDDGEPDRQDFYAIIAENKQGPAYGIGTTKKDARRSARESGFGASGITVRITGDSYAKIRGGNPDAVELVG